MNEERTENRGLRRLWVTSALVFVVGAAAGACFRWGMMASFPEGWNAGNIRHAHSHLMLMGWATPALMALMGARWPAQGGRRRERAVCVVGWTALVLAVASFPAFWLYGYDSVAVGSAELPVAAILSGLAIFSWYAFAAVYFAAHRGVRRTPAMRLWDLAVAALVVSSLGAWAVAGLMIGGVESPLWEAVTVHFFVDLFGGGWLLLGTVGLLRSQLAMEDSTNERIGRILVGAAMGFVFLIGLPRSYAPEAWPLFGSVAAGFVAAGLALITQRMWSRADRWSWRVLLLLALQVVMLAAIAIPPLAEWGLGTGLRLVYLHLALVGVVTMGLVVVADRQWGEVAVGAPEAWLAATVVLLVTMVPLTGLWPADLGGPWMFQLAFGGAAFAVLATGAAWLWAVVSARSKRSSHSQV